METTGNVNATGSAPTLSVDVLRIINEARMTYGLRHGDYQRYRQHCTRRVLRLRQILKLTQPDNKKGYRPKELPSELDNPLYFHLHIYDVERDWAYAMELKQESANTVNLRKKHHLIKRLKRAYQRSEAFYAICKNQQVDGRSILDAKAYSSTLKGYLNVEQEKWQNALEGFITARIIYERFATTSSSAHAEALYYSAVDEIDPNIRFSAYKLRLTGQTGSSSVEDVLDTFRSQHPDVIQQLELQLSEVVREGPKEEKHSVEITWRNKNFNVKNKEIVAAIAKAENGEDSVTEWAEAEKLVKAIIKEDKDATAKVASSRSARTSEELEYTYAYIAYNLYFRTILRDVRKVHELQSIGGKPQEMVKLYDGVLKNIENTRSLSVIKDDHAFESELDILCRYYRAHRCAYVAMAYAGINKVAEAFALYQRAQNYATEAKQLRQAHRFSDESLLVLTDRNLVELDRVIHTGTVQVHTASYLANDGDEDLIRKMRELNLDESGENTLVEGLSSLSIDVPSTFKPVVCKPFYFDLAANYVKYPESLSERANKPAGNIWKYFGFGGR
ncbi:signal recognition particle subunit srp68 [Apophysomyces ossiformis]|uniref:Signal recognition particle subunit SRP68 n=1 Tax=Apophysomyces ossiformis TaxID=679940 RepID=A0A8H7BTP8_9FUNG|nr:signal recognition particle subunit srp68 [Apophysomyces ossiformis]